MILLDIQKKTVPVVEPLQIRLSPIENTNFFKFSDGTVRKFKSVSKIKDTLSFFDTEAVAAIVAQKEGKTVEAILAEWEHKGNIGKERGNFIDKAFENFVNCVPFNADEHAKNFSVYQETPFTGEDVALIFNDFVRLKKCFLDNLGSKLITQYIAGANISSQIGNYGFATAGDLIVINEKKKEYFFFDVKADKGDKHEKTEKLSEFSFSKKSFLLGQMSCFQDCKMNKYLFQVLCSKLAVERTGGIWSEGKYINLKEYKFCGGGILHWLPIAKRFEVYTFKHLADMNYRSGLFIRDYFINLSNEKND